MGRGEQDFAGRNVDESDVDLGLAVFGNYGPRDDGSRPEVLGELLCRFRFEEIRLLQREFVHGVQ